MAWRLIDGDRAIATSRVRARRRLPQVDAIEQSHTQARRSRARAWSSSRPSRTRAGRGRPAKKPVPEEVTKKEEDEGPRRIKARDRDQRCAACRCEARFVCGVLFVRCAPRRVAHTTTQAWSRRYAHTCVKGIKLAAGELSDSTEEEEVEAMEMYARLAEAETPGTSSARCRRRGSGAKRRTRFSKASRRWRN